MSHFHILSLDWVQVLELLESEAGGGEEEAGGEDSEEEGAVLDPPAIYKKAAGFMLAGALLAATFADPMVDSIGNFSAASHIPPFFVAFVVTPFASNASELVSSIIFAKRLRKRNISLTFSQVYGAITMNNTLYPSAPYQTAHTNILLAVNHIDFISCVYGGDSS